jgi:choloylglycine hydrolase
MVILSISPYQYLKSSLGAHVKKHMIHGLLATTAAFLISTAPTTYACTDFKIKAKDGTLLNARTMEFGVELKSNFRSSPRGRAFETTTSNNKPGLSWKGKYGYLYIDGFGIDASFDGLNEAGLSFGYLYLPGETTYQTIPDGKDSQAIPYYLLGDWILGNFKSVDEVKQALTNIYVFPKAVPQLGDAILEAHAVVHDASGKSIVIEFYDNKINVTESMGVLTNSPKYNWQITNLRNYLSLSPDNPETITQGGISYSATGLGSGAFGLPGDASPPSRFVKASFMLKYVYPAENKRDLVNLAEHIINNFDLPSGLVRNTDNGKTETDTTQWTVFKDLTHKVVYYHTYNDFTTRSLALDKIDFSENAPLLKMPVSETPHTPVDMTSKFLNSKAPSPTVPASAKPH